MKDFTKVVRLGVTRAYGRPADVFCKIEYAAGRLSITGVEGPKQNGDAIGACGQIDMSLKDAQDSIDLAPGWTRDMLARFFDVWSKYHLNDMQAGSPAQSRYLEDHKDDWEAYKKAGKEAWSANGDSYPSHYTWACHALTAAGLHPDPRYQINGKPYHYGSAWLRIDVPELELEFLASLPDTDKKPAWV